MGDRAILETGSPPGFGKGMYGSFLNVAVVFHTHVILTSFSIPFHFGHIDEIIRYLILRR